MKTCKLVVWISFTFALSLFTFVMYKQNFTFIHSIWLISKHPVTHVQIEGTILQLDPGIVQYPWNGKSLKPLFDDMRPFTLQSDYDYLQRHIQSGGLNLTQMALLHVGNHNTMKENFYLAQPPLEDIMELPNETYCRVVVLNPHPAYVIGDHINIRIDLYNGYNKKLHRGGDIVMVWVTDTNNNASMATQVTDLLNGSYYSSIPLKWLGHQQIWVTVRYPRELIRSLVYTRHTMKSLRYVAAGFLHRNFSESTLCLPHPRVPGYSKLCNFTKRNYGQPWFCGHPRKYGLRCSDWKILRDMEFPKPLPLTPVEEKALAIPMTDPIPRSLKQDVAFLVTSGQLPKPPLCDKKNFTYTWTEKAPWGFYMQKKWIPTICSFPALSISEWAKCLSNTTVILAGDSNLLMWLHRIKSQVQCKITKMFSSNAWHTPLHCFRADINFSMIWQLHGYPEHPTSTYWADITHFRSACRRIDGIPASGKYVLIVHLFIHFSIHHPSVLINRLQCIRRAIFDLLERNPTAKVLIRAPFTSLKGWNPIFGGESVLHFFLAIIKQEFSGLYNRVILLNMWDMTVAGLNTDYHPNAWIDHQMAGIVLGHICNN